MPARRDACGWCKGPIPAGARVDALYCKQGCRQAAWRFSQGLVRREVADRPMRFAYGDPPYPGKAKKWYEGHRDYAGEVDHARLVEQLATGGFDGWALSTSAAALPDVLALCPRGVRVGAWFRGDRPTTSFEPLSAWEPVIYFGGRRSITSIEDRRLDALVYVSRPRTTDPDRVAGAKPARFCWWLFELLGMRPGDELTDLFPGSGGVSRAWAIASLPGVTDTSPPDPADVSPLQATDAFTSVPSAS